VVGGDCGKDCVHGTDDVQLDNDTPVYTLLPESRRCVNTLKLCVIRESQKAHGTHKRTSHSRRSVVDLPKGGGGVSEYKHQRSERR
jgi:hypothetical protein